MCHKPDDPDFQNLSVDRNIIQQCKEVATALQAQSRESSTASSPRTPSAFASLPLWPPPRSLPPKPSNATDVESGYGTDTDRSDMYTPGPGSPTSIGFTPVNTPRTPEFGSYRLPSPKNITSTPRVKLSPIRSPKTKSSKRPWTNCKAQYEEASSYQSSPEVTSSPKRRKVSPTSPSDGTMLEIGAAYALIQLKTGDGRRRRASA